MYRMYLAKNLLNLFTKKVKRMFDDTKALYGAQDEDFTFEDLLLFHTEDINNAILVVENLHKEATIYEPDIQKIFQIAQINDQELQRKIRQDIWLNPHRDHIRALGKYNHFLEQTLAVFEKITHSPVVEHVISLELKKSEKAAKEVGNNILEEVLERIWQDDPETIKRNLKRFVRQWEE